MKYFRAYPWGLQLFFFMMMIVTMLGFASTMFLMLLPQFSGYTLDQITKIDEHSPAALVNTSMIVQGIGSLFVYLIPAALFAYLAHPRPAPYLGLVKPGRSMQPLLAILVMLGAMPILMFIGSLIGQIDFGAKIKAEQAASDQVFAAFMNMPDFGSFLRTFLIIAIIPAFGEEMFYRGLLLRFSKKHSRSMALPILFTSAFFAYSHTNIYGLLSIFLAGILLAVIYNLTGSLWCSIAGHMAFNGSQIVLMYFGGSNPAIKRMQDDAGVPFYLVIAGAAVFAVSFYLLLKNRTPLPANWTDDYAPDEISENAD
jgi:membrane protease YdiL (CAAX protease family)